MRSEQAAYSDFTAESPRPSRPPVAVRTQGLVAAPIMRKGLNCSHIEPVEALSIRKSLWNVRACLNLVPDRNTDHR